MQPEVIGALVRNLIQFAGGGAVSAGYFSGDELTQAAGGIAFLAGLGWSVWQKVRAKRALGAAQAKPAA
jgi:hypothetical protein